MKKDFFAIYDALTAGMDESGGRIRAAAGYSRWSLAETDRRLGIATVSYTHLDVYKRQIQPITLQKEKDSISRQYSPVMIT